MPQLSSSTLTIGATLLVVHDALESTGESKSTRWSFTPRTTVATSLSGEGAEIRTCLAPAFKCRLAFSSVVNLPVDSITKSIPKSRQGKVDGSFSAKTRTCFPFSCKCVSVDSTVPEKAP